MPFDFQKFDQQCSQMSTDQLLQQHKHYTKLSAGAMTGTAMSALSIPLTLGVSGLAIGLSAGAHHNAKKKKLIVEKYLKARGIEAAQATEYANALANDQAQKQMWQQQQQQQSWQNAEAGPSSPSAASDHKQSYSSDRKDSRSLMEKGEKGGIPPSSSSSAGDDSPPPPPAYDESLNKPSLSTRADGPSGYASPQNYSQPVGSPPPPQTRWNQSPQNPYSAPQTGAWTPTAQPSSSSSRPQMEYGGYPGGSYGYGYGYGYGPGPTGPSPAMEYCGPQFQSQQPQQTVYANSAMYGAANHPVDTDGRRHVHFAAQ